MADDHDPFDDYDPDYDDRDDLDEDGNIKFECAAYFVDGHLYCPIAGTEECDWECPER